MSFNGSGEISLLFSKVVRYSTIFLYPFFYSGKKEDFVKALTETGSWLPQKFEPQVMFPEYAYFQPVIRDFLFSQEDVDKRPVVYLRYKLTKKNQDIEGNKLFFQVKYPENSFFNFKEILGENLTRNYPIDSIQISVFPFGVGILAIQVEQEFKYENEAINFQEVLCFNELARRTSPSFDYEKQKSCGLLPDKVSLVIGKDNEVLKSNNNLTSEENFEFKETNLGLIKEGHIGVSNTIKFLLQPLKNANVFDAEDKSEPRFQTALDERMIVYSYVCLKRDDIVTLRKVDKDFLNLILVDKEWGGSFGNDDLIEGYIKKHAYDNWIDYGTRYGFSNYSGVILTLSNFNASPDDFNLRILYSHFETMYYEIALLTFFYKTALLRFSSESAICAKMFYESIEDRLRSNKEEVYRKVKKLRTDFLYFTNKYWFAELTYQVQGIDIFDKWKVVTEIENLFLQVDKEISELEEYIDREQSTHLNLVLYFLAAAAVLGVIFTWILDYCYYLISANKLSSEMILIVVLFGFSSILLFFFHSGYRSWVIRLLKRVFHNIE
ncbi:MAG: hypothetical protein QW279_01730 [Candidatus Jordarchaeaceae archaeon]